MQAHRTFGTFGTYLISLLYISLQCCSCCPNSYIFCANHTGTCVGNGMVAYGKQKIYSYKSSSTSISCRNAQFGNPISGAKKCCIQSPALSGPAAITNIVNSISCGDTTYGYLQDVNDIHYYKLTTPTSNDTTYSLCGTGFDSSLTVYNSIGTKISDPYCDGGTYGYGDDCGDCVEDTSEIFTIPNQAAGTYYIRVQYFYAATAYGTRLYTLNVSCSHPAATGPPHTISDHFRSWTEISTPRMTAISDKSSLMAGYDMSTNRIWLVGGDSDEKWYYDIDAKAFIPRGSLSVVMDNLNAQSSTQILDSIYFANNNYLRSFNMTLERISTFSSPLEVGGINAPCLANDGRYIFVVGGENERNITNDAVNTFQIYDTVADVWSVGNAMNQERSQFSCNISPDRKYLYVFGGRFVSFLSTEIIQSAEKIDISSMTNVLSLSVYWNLIQTFSMKSNMYFSRSVVDETNALIYTIGGRDLSAFGDDRIQIIDPRYDLSTLSAYTLNYGRSSPSVIMVDQIIYVFGGLTGSGSTNEMDTFEISNLLIAPTATPTKYPSNIPTSSPSYNPTTTTPTNYPSKAPTNNPITAPTNIPSKAPSVPTTGTTAQPTNVPTYSQSPTMHPATFEPSDSPIREGAASVQTTNMASSTSMAGLNEQNENNNYGVIIASIIVGFVLLCCIIILLVVIVYNQIKNKEMALQMRVKSESNVISSASFAMEHGKVIHDQQFTDMHIHIQQEGGGGGGVGVVRYGLPAVVPPVVVSPGLDINEWISSDVDIYSDKITKGNDNIMTENNQYNADMFAVNDEDVLNDINSLDETCGALKLQ